MNGSSSAAALLVAAALWARPAHADDDASVVTSGDDASAPAPVSDEPPPPPPTPPPPRFPQHFVFGNGLALLLTSLSVGYELLPVAHHSIGLNLHAQYGGGVVSEIIGMKGAFAGVGAELGYRFYAFRDGPFGPFFGASFLTSVYHTQATFYLIDPDAFRYLQYGPAVDFGWSVHLDRTTVLALSVGAQYTFVSVNPRDLNELTRLLVGDGPRPRAGIQVGKVF